MKILHLASGDAWGGAERSLLHLVRGQQQLDAVAVLLFNEGHLAGSLREQGVHVEVIQETDKTLRELVMRVRAVVSAGGFEILHAHRYKEIAIASLAADRSAAVVATIHGLEPRSQIGSLRAALIWAALWLARLRGATFVPVSRELEDRLIAGLRTPRIVRVPNPLVSPPEAASAPIADLRTRLDWSSDCPLVGFVGRLEVVKGPDLLVDVALLVPDHIKFVLIGDGSLRAELQTRIDARGLAERVRLLGEVPDARRYLAQLDVLALPSRHEGLPMVLLEAAAAEIPVVAFDVGGVSEVLEETEATRLVPPGRAQCFAAELTRLCGHRSELDAEAKRWASSVRARFGLDTVVAAYQRIYQHAAPSGEAVRL